jgi:hypothetical protein
MLHLISCGSDILACKIARELSSRARDGSIADVSVQDNIGALFGACIGRPPLVSTCLCDVLLLLENKTLGSSATNVVAAVAGLQSMLAVQAGNPDIVRRLFKMLQAVADSDTPMDVKQVMGVVVQHVEQVDIVSMGLGLLVTTKTSIVNKSLVRTLADLLRAYVQDEGIVASITTLLASSFRIIECIVAFGEHPGAIAALVAALHAHVGNAEIAPRALILLSKPLKYKCPYEFEDRDVGVIIEALHLRLNDINVVSAGLQLLGRVLPAFINDSRAETIAELLLDMMHGHEATASQMTVAMEHMAILADVESVRRALVRRNAVAAICTFLCADHSIHVKYSALVLGAAVLPKFDLAIRSAGRDLIMSTFHALCEQLCTVEPTAHPGWADMVDAIGAIYRSQSDIDVSSHTIFAVLSTWRRNVTSIAVCTASVRLVASLAPNKRNADDISRRGGLGLVLDSLEEHSGEFNVVKACCQAIRVLAADDSLRLALLQLDAFVALFSCFMGIADADIQLQIASTMEFIVQYPSGDASAAPSRAETRGIDDARYPVTTALVATSVVTCAIAAYLSDASHLSRLREVNAFAKVAELWTRLGTSEAQPMTGLLTFLFDEAARAIEDGVTDAAVAAVRKVKALVG